MQLFADKFPVAYGQFYVSLGPDFDGDMDRCFVGQSNGLCGASDPNVLFFLTGLHTGHVTLNVHSHEVAPISDETFEEIVEVSFTVSDYGAVLLSWGGEVEARLNIAAGNYRLRYSANNFGKAEEAGAFDDHRIEVYLVEIWPETPGIDQVIRVTRDQANYWHEALSK